jgi:hypothetical protein
MSRIDTINTPKKYRNTPEYQLKPSFHETRSPDCDKWHSKSLSVGGKVCHQLSGFEETSNHFRGSLLISVDTVSIGSKTRYPKQIATVSVRSVFEMTRQVANTMNTQQCSHMKLCICTTISLNRSVKLLIHYTFFKTNFHGLFILLPGVLVNKTAIRYKTRGLLRIALRFQGFCFKIKNNRRGINLAAGNSR